MSAPTTPMPGGYGQDAAQPAAQRPRVRPGRIWYLVPLAALLGGVVWVIFGFTSLSSQINSFQRAPIPGGGVVSLSHSGGYTGYFEGPGAQSGQIPAFNVRVIPASAGAAVTSLVPYNGSLTYSVGNHEGKAVLTLQVSHPGRFRVVFAGVSNAPAGSDLAFGNSFTGGLVAGAVGGVLLILAGLVGLIVLFVIRVVKTNRAKSAAAAPAAASGWTAPVSGWSPGTQPPPSTQPSDTQPPPGPQPPDTQPPPAPEPSDTQPPATEPPDAQPADAQPPPATEPPDAQPPPATEPPDAQPPPATEPPGAQP
ncbi:MAG TPA: hypothetical protein VEC76_08240 [Streptosporangiaceae bacterium]|nr:hypothetical protein [Streptosporangiaceae bacterium]